MKSRLLIIVINASVLCGVAFAAIALSGQFFQIEFTYSVAWYHLFAIVVSQIILLALSAFAWIKLLEFTTGSNMPIKGGIEQVGFMLVGKYLPGKVGGVMIRALTAGRYGVSSGNVVEASFVELFIVLYIALSFGFSIYVWNWNPVLSCLLLGLFFIIGYYALLVSVQLLSGLSDKIRNKLIRTNVNSVLRRLSFKEFLVLSVMYSLPWIVTFLIILILIDLTGGGFLWHQVIAFLGAYMVAVAIGFVAIFAPGGVGVRETVFVALTGSIIDVALSLQLAFVIRIWSTIYDLFAAVIAYCLHVYRLHSGK